MGVAGNGVHHDVVFIFDGDCGFCRKWAGWLQHRVGSEARFVPFQAVPDLSAFGLTVREVQAASYLIEQRRPYRGGRGFARAMIRGQRMWKLAGWLLDMPGLRVVTDATYRAVAANRHRLPAPNYEVTS